MIATGPLVSNDRRMLFLRLFLFLAFLGFSGITANLEFNNVKCLTHGKEYVEFEYCYLKSINRTYKYFSLKAVIHQLPVRNVKVEFKILKRDNRHIFEQFNGVVNVCKFFKDGQNAIAGLIFNTFTAYSNINHTCPINHDIILEKLPIQYVNKMAQPFIPQGPYLLNLSWYTDNIARADVIVYFTKS
ncbi:uncharacterized protein LOC111593955 [Drosophila hydei]|uniref:Uncharacterized protein LOC111593955 n=1 Tax=Drosophila hydei TaxID=7224 RepID=A0A6J1L898_DROHY|nr:uncharacterized protein LOC111593955 [Drosophila hydei]